MSSNLHEQLTLFLERRHPTAPFFIFRIWAETLVIYLRDPNLPQHTPRRCGRSSGPVLAPTLLPYYFSLISAFPLFLLTLFVLLPPPFLLFPTPSPSLDPQSTRELSGMYEKCLIYVRSFSKDDYGGVIYCSEVRLYPCPAPSTRVLQ